MRHFSLRLLPDLLGGRVVVGLPIVGIVVLVGHEKALRILLIASLGLKDGAVRTLQRIGQNDACAISLSDAPFFARVFRDHKLHGVAERRPDHGIGNPGIAGGRVYNDLLSSEFLFPYSFLDHVPSRAVLDATSGVGKLGLSQDFDLAILAKPVGQAI